MYNSEQAVLDNFKTLFIKINPSEKRDGTLQFFPQSYLQTVRHPTSATDTRFGQHPPYVFTPSTNAKPAFAFTSRTCKARCQ